MGITLRQLETIGTALLTEQTPFGPISVSRGPHGLGLWKVTGREWPTQAVVSVYRARSARRAMFYVERFAKKSAAGAWQPIVPPTPPKCDLCDHEARWRHPMGGQRCDECPRPTK